MKISRLCPLCGTINTYDLNVTERQLNAYENRFDLIQNIFPNLSASEREFIKTGYCMSCQEMLFSCDEEDAV